MVAIKNFDMPKDCDSCPFYMYHNDAEDACNGERHKKCHFVNIDIDDMYQDWHEEFNRGYNLALDDIKEQLERR